MRFSLLALLSSCFALGVSAQEFANADAAINALDSRNSEIKRSAIEYLAKTPKKSIPLLKNIIKNKNENWPRAMFALSEISKETAVAFYIELLANNLYEKEEDGTRKTYGLGSKNGCLVLPNLYGGALARNLAFLGDKKAVPVLREALRHGDRDVRKNAFYGLYKLEDLSLDDLFDRVEAEKEVDVLEIIMSIGWESVHSATPFAIGLFDRVIAEFPANAYQTASAHFWKIQCFELLEMYDRALLECDEVLRFQEFDNLTNQIPERRANILSKMRAAQ